MGKTYYIAAIELSSSKVSGAVGVETNEGMMIVATASIPVDGFISKGVVRNVDETSKAIGSIINMLEDELKDVSIKKAYISFAGLSVHSIKSKVCRGFGEYRKITPEIIDDMERENSETFQVPDGYKRMQVETQEYRFEGNVNYNPVGTHTQFIECNYLNIVMKEQFYKQLCESFGQAEIEIADSFSAARIDADILLSEDLRRNGCALVNIGAETTTIQIYDNDKPKMLTVLPLGSNNITRDLTVERVSFAQAEEIKIIRGYKSPGNNEGVDSETVNNIIDARMSEILQNVRYQIEESGERVRHIVFTGGGSKLKNLRLLLEEYLPNFSIDIKPEPQFNILCKEGINVNGVITTALYGLLKQGEENCCEELVNEEPAAVQPTNGEIFTDEEMTNESSDDYERMREERQRAKEEEKKRKEEEKRRKEEEKKRKKERERQQKQEKGGGFGSFFKEWLNNMTHDPDEDEENKEREENTGDKQTNNDEK